MKKLIQTTLALVCVLAVLFALTACVKNVNVQLPSEQEGYTVSGEATAVKGENYQFTVTIDNNYEKGENFAVKANGTAVVETDGKYVVENVTEDITVTVEGVVKKAIYNVTLPTGDGYTVSGAASVMKGESYEFTVTLGETYEKGENFVVKANGTALTENNGKYVVANATENITITVDGVVKKTFRVSFPLGVGFTVDGAEKVTIGENYEFTVTFSETYEKGESFAVKVNGNVVEETNGKYVVENVTENLSITVDGVDKKPLCQVTLPDAEDGSYTITGESTVMKGENYEFTVTIAEGYKKGEDFAVKANGKALTEVGGKYIVENVTSAIVITVEGVEEATLKATFSAEGFEDALENDVEEFSYSAENFTFQITLSKHYTQNADAISVYYKTADGEETLVTPADGTYTIENPHKDIEIIVKGVVLNTYKVTFYRNSVEKHTLDVYAKSVLTDDQLNAAKAAVINDGETFSAWVGDVTAPIEENTVFYVYTEPTFGTAVDGSPITDATEVTGEYSAAGFEKVYKIEGAKGNVFAEIDLATAKEVRFAFKLEPGWILIDGWMVYAHMSDVWHEVVMTNDATGKWTVSITGPAAGATENLYTTTYQGATLSEIFANWNFCFTNSAEESVGANVRITELRKTDYTLYVGEVITTGAPAEGFTVSTDKVAPADFSSVYNLKTVPAGTKFADVDISGYSEVKFYFIAAQGYFNVNGWGAYAENAATGNNWVSVVLTNNGGGTWAITINGQLQASNDDKPSNPYAYTATGSTLKAVLDSWFSFADVKEEGTYLTEVRGIKAQAKVLIEGGVLKSDTTQDATEEAPAGFEKTYLFNTGNYTTSLPFSDVDVSEYAELCFAYKSSSWMLFAGWSKYLHEVDKWVSVVMKQTEIGKWDVSVYSTQTTQTFTYEGDKLSEILKSWCNNVGNTDFYFTELRGTKAA